MGRLQSCNTDVLRIFFDLKPITYNLIPAVLPKTYNLILITGCFLTLYTPSHQKVQFLDIVFSHAKTDSLCRRRDGHAVTY